MAVTLEALPDHRDRLIVVGTSVRKHLDILLPYLQSLAAQELPPRTRLHPVFVDDFLPNQADAKDCLKQFCADHGGELLRGLPSAVGDFDDGPQHASHQWGLTAFHRVGANKNKILKRALELKADYVWLVDADLILDRTTLASLLACDKHVVCGIFWTRWSRQTTETQKVWASPQVWLRNPYFLDGRGMDEPTFRGKLVARQLTRVWGQGANTLLSRKVLEAGLDFSPAPEVPQQGLMAGEDRQFCIKAERGHIEMWSDPWPDIFHIYHRAEHVEQIPAMTERLWTEHPAQAKVGDLVNVVLTALEPIPANNGWTQIAPQPVRGRLGTLALLPEVEDAIQGLTRGQDTIIPVHFPIHYPMPYLRGRRRLIRVHLVDCKPNGYPPILEDDLHHRATGNVQDLVSLTPQQMQAVLEAPKLELVTP